MNEPSLYKRGEQRGYRCPRDGSVLATVAYGDSKIQVEACGQCRGLWLDKGEYESILRHSEQKVDSESTARYWHDLLVQLGHVVHGPEGPLDGVRNALKVMYLLELRFAIDHPTVQAALQSLPRV